MKIGIDGRFWDETGVGRYIRNLVLSLEEIDKDNTYVIFALTKDVEQIRKELNNPHFIIKGVDIPWHSLREQYSLPKILENEELDLMHFPYFSIPIFYNKPFVITVHDLILHHFSTGKATTLPRVFYHIKKIGYKYIISQAAKRSEKIIAVSQATKNEIIDHLSIDEKKIAVIYEGVDNTLKQSKSFEKSSEKYFLHVGNVYPHKNIERLVDAFVKSGFDDTKLIFVGKKDYFMKRLEKKIADSDFRNIQFLGFVDDKTLASLYKNSLATIVPSLMEGFGLPILEAMSCGSLVVASDIPSLREIGKNGVMYIDPFNIQEISDKMRSIAQADRDDFKEIIERGKSIVKTYSWEKMAKETLKVYESCVSLRPD
ncbi:MAG: glycosyltransferase family 4 protein [Candidatus Levybacteria bacterium]|nr:glycosyltransferase family 4 protein [Candidatus Levybacteria bacterium]